MANAANTSAVHDALRTRADGFAAEVRDREADRALLAVQGPRAGAVLSAASQADLTTVRYYAISRATVAGREVLLARTGYTGEDGFEIFCSHSDAQPIWQALTIAGRACGLVPAGRRVPCAGHAVLDRGAGACIGEITKGAPSPTLGHPIEMA